MRRRMLRRAARFALFAVVGVAAAGFLITSLWNWLVPSLFGLPAIRFGQALGLLVLTRILFGGFRGGRGGGPMHWRGRMAERWQNMTPEQRETFRAGSCGRRPAPAPPVSPVAV